MVLAVEGLEGRFTTFYTWPLVLVLVKRWDKIKGEVLLEPSVVVKACLCPERIHSISFWFYLWFLSLWQMGIIT